MVGSVVAAVVDYLWVDLLSRCWCRFIRRLRRVGWIARNLFFGSSYSFVVEFGAVRADLELASLCASEGCGFVGDEFSLFGDGFDFGDLGSGGVFG